MGAYRRQLQAAPSFQASRMARGSRTVDTYSDTRRMGIIDYLRNARGMANGTYYRDIASPFAPRPNHLEAIAWADLAGIDHRGPLSRADAMSIPAVVRGRGLIVATIARSPLIAEREPEPLEAQPEWINRTSGPISAFHRMLWTADDLLFYGWSLWKVRRNFDGRVIDAARVPIDSWNFNDHGEIIIGDETPIADEVILIPGIHEGILSFGADTLRQAKGLLATAERVAANPVAITELHQTNEYPMTEEQVDKLIARWSAARRGENGGVSFTSSGIETKEHGAAKEHLLIEGRAASAIDIARLLGIPSSMIDANQAGTSLSYSNTASRMNELITFGIAPLMSAISSRLSLDDMSPRGTNLKFDTSEIVTQLSADDGTPLASSSEASSPPPPASTDNERNADD